MDTETIKFYLEQFQKDLPNVNAWICGGAALAYIGEHLVRPNDLDIFFEDKESFETCKAYFEDNITIYNLKSEHFTSQNAITFENKYNGFSNIQLIHKSFEPIEDILESFDLYNVKVAVNILDFSIIDLRGNSKNSNKLIFDKFENTNIKRIAKYIHYGHTIDREDFFKVLQMHQDDKIVLFYDAGNEVLKGNALLKYCNASFSDNAYIIPWIFEFFKDYPWLDDALFRKMDSNVDWLMKAENLKHLFTREQFLAHQCYHNNYKEYENEIKDLFPELFIGADRIYQEKFEHLPF